MFVVENETSYLALPEVPNAIAIWGEGFAVTALERLPWLSGKDPTTKPLPHLTLPEQSLYRDLVEDRYDRSVRLEQERIRFSLVRHALGPCRRRSPKRWGT